MAYQSRYDPEREADLSKQSARGKSIARRGRDIKDFRASLPRGADPENFWTFKQKEYDYSPRWRETLNVDKGPGADAKSGFLAAKGDAGQMWRDLSGPVRETGLYKDASTMAKDIGTMVNLPGLLSLLPQLGSIGENIEQNEENEEILGNAYSDEVRKSMMSPSDRAFYEKYMRIGDSKSGQEADYYYDEARKALENAQITKRVNYALGEQPFGYDTSADAGVAAFGADKPVVDYGTLSGRLQSGLQGTKGGRDFIKEHAIPKEGDTPAITRAIENFYGGQSRLALDEELNTRIPPGSMFESASPEAVSIETIPEEGWDEQFIFPPRSALSMQGQNFGRGKAPMSPGESELLMDVYTDPFHGDQYYRQGHIPTIDEIAGTGYTDYRGVNPFREPYVPMEGPSPVPLPPYLSADTDWFTSEPEAKGLIPRGLEELIIDQYGVDAPGVEREREWPNTPPPGYQDPPPWYSRAWDWLKEGDWPRY